MNEAEKLFEETFPRFEFSSNPLSSDIIEYGEKVWNAALDWAAENAQIETIVEKCSWCPPEYKYQVDKESILEGKI